MKVMVNAKKKTCRLIATGKEKHLFALICAFAGDAIIYPKSTRWKITKLVSLAIDMIVIDLSDEAVSKEFIQLLLRMK